jgi:wobble nucleotide-excising tRNase
MKKDTFLERALEEPDCADVELEAVGTLRERAKRIFGEAPQPLEAVFVPSASNLTAIEEDLIWEKKIIGKQDVPIASLIQHLGSNDWVNEGRSFLEEGKNTCPFCQKNTINEELRKNLSAFFDEAFVEDIQSLKTFQASYEQESQNLANLLEGIIASEKAKKEGKLDIEKLEAFVKTLDSQLSTNFLTIKAKVKEPSREFKLQSIADQAEQIIGLIEAHNQDVLHHNKIVENFSEEKKKLVSAIWKTVVGLEREMISSFQKKRANFEKAIKGIENKKKDLDSKLLKINEQIREANKSVTSVQPAVDEINKLLKAYCFDSFEIVPSERLKNSYCIQRPNGELATDTLSEGEVTFITFLYYLQRANGGSSEANVKTPRVLVIDDPISSLDSNILYVVSSLIKGLLKKVREKKGDIKQVILLTHNVFFHKEVSFVDGRSNGCNKTHFWILRKISNVTSITAHKIRNPIETSYELLWREVKEHVNDPSRVSLSLQNSLRRILENYFKILGKMGDDKLVAAFKEPEEKEICRSLLCWVNDGSHTIPDDLHVQHGDDASQRYLNVFRKIFEHTKNQGHYDMMMVSRD